MEAWFLALLIVSMVAALASGYPVAFALPGSAILSIAIAALCGWLFVGDPDAFFIHGGPNEWLSAGVTNFRSLYWVVERDTLIAIPLFIFMGIMLQRSRIAEDLLVAMARLFGPLPGGLGISVVFVGALLAATTGIVGATVIAMGLISLPAMLRANYSHSLSCGAICASGTLGQIIPPSIVLIILADQLSSAADQANTLRKAEYRELSGEYAMPSEFDVVSASAGDMFMGALLPGLILVGLYMAYIFVSALIDPRKAPAVARETGYDRAFVLRLLLALAPPLLLILVVLGSILTGVATVNQAGAIGAVGALLMSSYRLARGRKRAYYPVILAALAIIALALLRAGFDLNIRAVDSARDVWGIRLALLAVAVLLFALLWSIHRAWRSDNILNEVMLETARTTSMVFIILLGAAMLTAAFRGFGGEELVRDYLGGLPGGFWTQFAVVMLVIFLLGFFLDFIEIAVVVVPIVAPILLADPSANVTAVWLGVMIGLNIQTSFLTPPFGFALFYLRGVASQVIKTVQIYKGVTAFIVLQLLALVIAATSPQLVNYLPRRNALVSETAPPPNNPRLQLCLEEMLQPRYVVEQGRILQAIEAARALDDSDMPENHRDSLLQGLENMATLFQRMQAIQVAADELQHFSLEYAPLHREVRAIQSGLAKLDGRIAELEEAANDESYADLPDQQRIARLQREVDDLRARKQVSSQRIPAHWQAQRERYLILASAERKARQRYRRQADDAYQALLDALALIAAVDSLRLLETDVRGLDKIILEQDAARAMEAIKAVEQALSGIPGASAVKSPLSRARRALKRTPDRGKATGNWQQAVTALERELAWRQAAAPKLVAGLERLEQGVRDSIGLRLQARLDRAQAESVAACQARHRDISLAF